MKKLQFGIYSLLLVFLIGCKDGGDKDKKNSVEVPKTFADKILDPKKGDLIGATISMSYTEAIERIAGNNITEKREGEYFVYVLKDGENESEVTFDFNEEDGLYHIAGDLHLSTDEDFKNTSEALKSFFTKNYGNPTSAGKFQATKWENVQSKNGKVKIEVTLSIFEDIDPGGDISFRIKTL